MKTDHIHNIIKILISITLLLVACIAAGTFIVHNITIETGPTSQTKPPPPEILDSAISIEDINLVPPDDILNEVSYYSGGGGGSDQQEFECPTAAMPTINAFTQTEWLYPFYFYDGCGWADGELVSVKVMMPDGKIQTDQLSASESFTYSYEMTTDMLPGEYVFGFSGASGQVEKLVEVNAPVGPHVYRLLSEQKLVLYGFKPREKVRVFIFYDHPESNRAIYTFVGWRQIVVDKLGQASLKIPDEELLVYFVDGKKSGLVVEERSSLPASIFFKDWFRLPFLP